jgi:hypothetical protein
MRPRGDDFRSGRHDVRSPRSLSTRREHIEGQARLGLGTCTAVLAVLRVRGERKYGFSSGPLPGVKTSREQHHTVCGYYRRHFETPLGLHSMFDYASGMFVHHKPLPVDVHPLPVEMVRRVVLKRILPRRDSCECYVRLLSLAVQQALDAFSEARVSKVVT